MRQGGRFSGFGNDPTPLAKRLAANVLMSAAADVRRAWRVGARNPDAELDELEADLVRWSWRLISGTSRWDPSYGHRWSREALARPRDLDGDGGLSSDLAKCGIEVTIMADTAAELVARFGPRVLEGDPTTLVDALVRRALHEEPDATRCREADEAVVRGLGDLTEGTARAQDSESGRDGGRDANGHGEEGR